MLATDERLGVVMWAAELLAQGDGLIVDLETTGLAEDAEIVQVGVVDLQGNVLLGALVRPAAPIPVSATAVHGITDDQVKRALTFAELYTTLTHLLTGRRLIAYNAVLEGKILHQTCRRYRLGYIRPRSWTCAMINYAAYWGERNARYGGWRWQSLSSACFQQEIPVNGAHSAVVDCQLTLELIRRMAAKAEKIGGDGAGNE